MVFNSTYYAYANFFLILLMEYIYILFLREIYQDSMSLEPIKSIYKYTILLFPIIFFLFIILSIFRLNTNSVFFVGHIFNGPFMIAILMVNYKRTGYFAVIKYGMVILFLSVLFTAIFSIRFNLGYNQFAIDSYPLVFVRIGMLIDVFLFQFALMQYWLHQEKLLITEKIESQLATERIRTKISNELHDDLGASLSGLMMYSHLTKSQIEPNNLEAHYSLDIMANSSSQMVSKLKDIVWFTNPNEDSL